MKTPEEWAADRGLRILDPDGWRFESGQDAPKDFSEPIDEVEFERRLIRSTVARGF